MLINAINKADKVQHEDLMKWINAEDFDAKKKISAVTNIYNIIGIDKLAEQKIAYYFEQSTKYLDAVNLPDCRKAELRRYAHKMMKRNY